MAKETTTKATKAAPVGPNPILQLRSDYNPAGMRAIIDGFIQSSAAHRALHASLTGNISQQVSQQRVHTERMTVRKNALLDGITKEEAPNERLHAIVVAKRLAEDDDYQIMVKEAEFFTVNLADLNGKLSLSRAALDSAREELTATRLKAELFLGELAAVTSQAGANVG